MYWILEIYQEFPTFYRADIELTFTQTRFVEMEIIKMLYFVVGEII